MSGETPLRSVLVIEDEKNYAEVIVKLHACVAKAFYEECTLNVAYSWTEARASIEVNRPDAIVLDLTLLPDMGPESTLEALKSAWQILPPVVILTGSEDKALRRRAILSGAESLMFKQEFNRHPEGLCEKLYEAFLRRLRDA